MPLRSELYGARWQVEGQLRAMGKAIDSDDVNAEADELAQELSMNGQLNGLKDRFSEQVPGVAGGRI